MNSPTVHPAPKVEQSGSVRIITFTGEGVRDVENTIARELEGNLAGLAECQLLLDFTKVETLSRVELETLIRLHKQLKDGGGRLTLFNLSIEVFGILWAEKIERRMGVCREQANKAIPLPDNATLPTDLAWKETAMSSVARTPPKAEQSDGVKIIRFTAGQNRDVENVIAKELEGLTDGLGKSHLLLDFTNVEYITSVELGTLIGLHKRMKATGGRLTLFNLNLQVFEVFAVTRLDTLLGICREA
jgi:anti-sigma B factor antagonist